MSGWPPLDDATRLAWLRLIRTPRIGPATFQDLINLFGGAQAALDALPGFTARKGRPIQPVPLHEAEAEMEAACALGARFVARFEAGYPALLGATDRMPPLLCARFASPDCAARPAVGMVGTRSPSAGGITLARRMAAELGEAGLVIVSGLARGLDAAAHMGALDTGTIAFLAGGLANPYPPENAGLAEAIVDRGGALYSEVPLDWTARAQDFPRRNRLVAGSVIALVVIEAARRSGTLITADQANELGRTVMAVPGFPLDPRSAGPNALLRDGAVLVRDARDVLEEIGPDPVAAMGMAHDVLPLAAAGARRDMEEPAPLPSGPEPLERDADALLTDAMGAVPMPADDLVSATGLPASAVRGWLLEHELAGTVQRYPGDRFAWAPER